uniref:Uncharacterized protein n=1 Tax=Macrostomum lignano TaxID=282301 RepID=A0A1I8JHL6_9PLAT
MRNLELNQYLQPTRFILLRRFVQNETDKRLEFAGLQINFDDAAVQLVSRSSQSVCSAVGLDRLRPGTMLVACLPCQTLKTPLCSLQPLVGNFKF